MPGPVRTHPGIAPEMFVYLISCLISIAICQHFPHDPNCKLGFFPLKAYAKAPQSEFHVINAVIADLIKRFHRAISRA